MNYKYQFEAWKIGFFISSVDCFAFSPMAPDFIEALKITDAAILKMMGK